MPPLVGLVVYLAVTAGGAALYQWGTKQKSPLGTAARIFGGVSAVVTGLITALIAIYLFLP